MLYNAFCLAQFLFKFENAWVKKYRNRVCQRSLKRFKTRFCLGETTLPFVSVTCVLGMRICRPFISFYATKSLEPRDDEKVEIDKVEIFIGLAHGF